MCGPRIPCIVWTVEYDEVDVSWYIGMRKGGQIIRLNCHYLTREAAVVDQNYLAAEYETICRGKEVKPA